MTMIVQLNNCPLLASMFELFITLSPKLFHSSQVEKTVAKVRDGKVPFRDEHIQLQYLGFQNLGLTANRAGIKKK